MKILMINKFLYPNGGSETYMFKLGDYLAGIGHQVEYFGMEHEGRCVGNRVNAYTTEMDFHGGSKLSKLTYPLKTIYSSEARRKIRLVLDDFQPDVCHLNNFNYQLTPSIILEIVEWRRQTGRKCKIIFTAHDYQLVCPNNMCQNPNTNEICEKCLGGDFINCIKGKCIHGSIAKSVVGATEAYFWRRQGAYKYIDTVICCSDFVKKELSSNPWLKGKMITLRNFVDVPNIENMDIVKGDYVLYFGRFTRDKGMEELIEACRQLPDIPFVFAGAGNYIEEISELPNATYVGFVTGEALARLIRAARFSVCPSIAFENCPFSVMESMMLGTPVLGAGIGGIPELIDSGVNGELLKSGDAIDLSESIKKLWSNKDLIRVYTENCRSVKFDTVEQYAIKFLKMIDMIHI